MPSASGIRAGQAYVELSLKDGALTKGLRSVQGKLKAFGASVRSIGLKIAGIGLALKAPFVAAEGIFSNMGAEMARMASRTGVSVEALSQLSYAAKQCGVDAEGLETSFKRMQRNIGEAVLGMSRETAQVFEDLGINVQQIKNLAPEKQFEIIAQQLSRVQNPTMRAAAAMEIFGRNGTAILPLLEQGAAGIQKLREQADNLGLTMSGRDANAALAFNQSLARLWDVVKIGAFNIGAALAPALNELIGTVTGFTTKAANWIKTHQEIIVTAAKVASGVLAVGAGLVVLGYGFAAVGTVIGGVIGGITAIASVVGFVLSPFGLIVAAVGGAIFAFAKFTAAGQNLVSNVSRAFGQIFHTVKDTFGGIFDAIAGGDLALAGTIAIKGLQLAFLEGVDAIASSVGGSFGDFLGTLGGQLAHGDLSGAWNTMLDGLYASWANFSQAVVGVASKVANAIIDKWESIDGTIADSIQHIIEKGGIFGKLLAPNYDAEEQKKIEANIARLKETARIKQQEADDAKVNASDLIKQWGEKAKLSIGDWKSSADAAAKKANAPFSGGAHLNPEIADLKKQLADLANQAHAAKTAAQQKAADAQKQFDNAGLDLNQKKYSVAGVFNSVAAGRALGGGRDSEKVHLLRSINRHVEKTAQNSGNGLHFGG